MDIKERMHSTKLYNPGDEELLKEQNGYLDRLYDFNMTRPTEPEKREAMLKEMFAEIGEGCYIEPPFHANFGENTFILAVTFMRILILLWLMIPIFM